MKPDWKDAPEWAQYLAIDSDGKWWWHELEPEPDDIEWCSNGRFKIAYSHDDISWLETLEKRPS